MSRKVVKGTKVSSDKFDFQTVILQPGEASEIFETSKEEKLILVSRRGCAKVMYIKEMNEGEGTFRDNVSELYGFKTLDLNFLELRYTLGKGKFQVVNSISKPNDLCGVCEFYILRVRA